jgi:Cof subfamily protein (haloacid dehalogenase superfamily)
MKRKLIFLDIDGTLTVPGSNVPPESAVEAVRKARACGHKVFLCSGRNPGMLAPVLVYGFDGYVGSGGGYVVCGDQVLFDCPMSEEQRVSAMKFLAEGGVFRTIEARDAAYGDRGMAEFLNKTSGGNSELVRWRKALEEDLNIRPMEEYDGRPLYKIVFMCERKEQLDAARALLEKDFEFLVQDLAAANCLNGEMINRKFDKGSGVRQIAEALGADLSDTIGFGDSMNDLEMIRTVGTSVCMGNGSPALKEICGLVCPAVEEDGLAKMFRQLGLDR